MTAHTNPESEKPGAVTGRYVHVPFDFAERITAMMRRASHWATSSLPGNPAQWRKDLNNPFGPSLVKFLTFLDWLQAKSKSVELVGILSAIADRYDLQLLPKLTPRTVENFTEESFDASVAWADFTRAQAEWRKDPSEASALNLFHSFVAVQREAHDVILATEAL